MARQTGPKIKLMRKVGVDLGLKSNPVKTAKRIGVLPGQHGRRGRRKLSDYGIQLLEKQKVRIMYGIMERQLRKYFNKAAKNPKATGSALISLLERRLDSALYRLGFAPTRAAARQLINHGHVKVNNKKVTIPSYILKTDETINLTDKALKIPYIAELVKQKNQSTPAWLSKKSAVAKVVRLPEKDDITEDINEQLIVEFYSR